MLFVLITTTIISAFRGWKWWSLLPATCAFFLGVFFMILLPADQGVAMDMLFTLAAVIVSSVMAIRGREEK